MGIKKIVTGVASVKRFYIIFKLVNIGYDVIDIDNIND